MEAYFNNYRRNHKLDYDLGKNLFFSCISRLISPSSKTSSWRHRQRFLIDFEDIELHHLYDCLDVLADHKDKITARLNKSIDALYQRDLTIAKYDVSTFYFESFIEDDLRRRGMSKEHRPQETQVVLGLLINSEGVPFAYKLFPGNTAEVHTLLKVVNKFRKQYKVQDVIVVADSGLNQLVISKTQFQIHCGLSTLHQAVKGQTKRTAQRNQLELAHGAVRRQMGLQKPDAGD